jgi:hypothetical protein
MRLIVLNLQYNVKNALFLPFERKNKAQEQEQVQL